MGDWSLTLKEERMLNKFDSVETAPDQKCYQKVD